jgi:hypothetical protein
LSFDQDFVSGLASPPCNSENLGRAETIQLCLSWLKAERTQYVRTETNLKGKTMKTQALLTSLLALAAGPTFAADHAVISGYALSDDGATLVVMADVNAPGEVMTYSLASPLKAIAWRPVTGELLGLGRRTRMR